MERKLIITYSILIVLTLIIFFIPSGSYFSIILLLALVKFWLVAFRFMQLNQAHIFWKVLLICFTVIFGGIILLLQ